MAANTVEVRAPSAELEGTRLQVQRWLKKVGEAVTQDEPLIEVETDKVTVEIAAPATGILCDVFKREQEDISPGELLARIDTSRAAAGGSSVVRTAPAPQAQGTASPTEHAWPTAHPPVPSSQSAPSLTAARARISPAVRQLLEQHGLSPESIPGSGQDGRITVDDVLRHVRESEAARGERASAVAPADRHLVPHSAIRRRTAEHMVQSLLKTAPHVTTVFEADLSSVLAHRAAHREEFNQRGVPLSLTAYFLAACVDAIRAVPESNARWHEEGLELFDSIDIGVATAVEGKGLLVPVVRAVDKLDLFQTASELNRLVMLARQGHLTSQDVQGGTFTISNHGVSGSLVATPIVIHQPQVAILGIGKLEKRVVVIERGGADEISVQPRCYVTLTIDHRAMDGDRANRFLAVLVKRLESWPRSEANEHIL